MIHMTSIRGSIHRSCADESAVPAFQLFAYERILQRHVGRNPIPPIRRIRLAANQRRQISPGRSLVAKVSGGELYLRQFDPRLFLHYDWLLAPQQRVRLFGPVTGWSLHLDGEWQTFAPPTDVKPAAGWHLTAEQVARTEDAQRINRAMASLPAGGIGLRRDRAQHGHLLLERARAHGLKAERCLTRFLEHGWTVHLRFDLHPEISCRLQRMSLSDDFPYLAAVSDLDNAAFSRIREEMAKGDWP